MLHSSPLQELAGFSTGRSGRSEAGLGRRTQQPGAGFRRRILQIQLRPGRPASNLEALANAPRRVNTLSVEQTLQAVALPPESIPALGPRVEHLIASHAGTLSCILSAQLQLPEVMNICNLS